MEKIKSSYKPIRETDFLEDHELDAIEAGACDSGCRKACLPGNQNAGNGNGNGTEKPAEPTPTTTETTTTAEAFQRI